MRRADPPPPTSLEGQFLIAMPSLREGPFARSVVYMCAHRDDGAMGIVINQRAEEIDFGQLLAQLDIVPETEAIRLPPRAQAVRVLRGGPVETGRGFVLHSSDYGANDSTVKIGDSLPDRHARHPARDRRGDRPIAGGACAWLRRLGLRAARERDPRQRLAHLPRRRRPHLRSRFQPQIRPGAWRSSASTKGCCPPTRATPEGRPLGCFLRWEARALRGRGQRSNTRGDGSYPGQDGHEPRAAGLFRHALIVGPVYTDAATSRAATASRRQSHCRWGCAFLNALGLAVLIALAGASPLLRRDSLSVPAWLQAHVGEGEGQIAPVVLERARALYQRKGVRNPCYFAFDATRPHDLGGGLGRRFYIICEAQGSFRAISAGHGGGRDLDGVADFANGRRCVKNFGNAIGLRSDGGRRLRDGRDDRVLQGLLSRPAGGDAVLMRAFLKFDGEGETGNARERAIGGHPAVLLRGVCRRRDPSSPHADPDGYVPFGKLVNYEAGRSDGCTSWSPSDAAAIMAMVRGRSDHALHLSGVPRHRRRRAGGCKPERRRRARGSIGTARA